MKDPVDRAVRAIARRNSCALVWAQFAERAVLAALEIVELVREQYRGEVAVGIGLNSGRVVAGTVGGGGRVEFTAIGDAVNTAARVEAATRETGDEVLITDATRVLLPDGQFEFDERPPMALKGKRDHVRLWEPRVRAISSPSGTARRGRSTAPVVD